MAVTRVLDWQGNVIHDCAQLGCEVSWDGVNLASGVAADGAKAPGPEWRRVNATTMQQIPPDGGDQPAPGSIQQG